MIRVDVQKLGEERFQTMIAELEDYAIFLLDINGVVSTWNKGAEKIKGYAASEIVGKSHKIFYTEADRTDLLPERLLDQATQNGKVVHEGWRIRKNGKPFWGNVTITALHNDKGELAGFLKVTRDLTERRNAEENVQAYIAQLEQNNESLRKSEDRYHQMVAEVSDYAIILLDPNGIIIDWNKGAENVKGYRPEEVIGKSFKIFYAERDRENHVPEKLLQRAIDEGSVLHEGWRIRKDGTRFWGLVSMTALHDSHGAITGFSKVTRDLTDRKIAEDKLIAITEELKAKNETLRQSEERYHRMIAEVQDYAILLLNETGAIENWNLGATQIKGYQAHEIIGKHFRIFYPQEDLMQHLPEKLLTEARQAGRAMHEGWRVRKDGTRFWGSVVITALHDEGENVIGFTKVTRDLTDRKRAEDALKESAMQLDQKNKSLEALNGELSSFVYVASHDMKEPLRKIQTYISMFNEPLSEKGKGYLDRIQNSAARLQNLIEDLLSYSQVSNDVSETERLSLNEIIETVKHDLEIGIAQRKALIKIEKLPEIIGVRFQVYQVFLNLLSNALKFSQPDTPPEVHIKAEEVVMTGADLSKNGRKYYHIEVTDNGIGFDSENAARIFEVFQRLHPRQAYAGTGIGLSIVKKVMENHLGMVAAESTPGKGSTFHLYFPVAV